MDCTAHVWIGMYSTCNPQLQLYLLHWRAIATRRQTPGSTFSNRWGGSSFFKRSILDFLFSFAFSQSLSKLSLVRSVVEKLCQVQGKKTSLMTCSSGCDIICWQAQFFLGKYRSVTFKISPIPMCYVGRNVWVTHTAPSQLNEVLWLQGFSKYRIHS